MAMTARDFATYYDNAKITVQAPNITHITSLTIGEREALRKIVVDLA
jgi:hypothetical protein